MYVCEFYYFSIYYSLRLPACGKFSRSKEQIEQIIANCKLQFECTLNTIVNSVKYTCWFPKIKKSSCWQIGLETKISSYQIRTWYNRCILVVLHSTYYKYHQVVKHLMKEERRSESAASQLLAFFVYYFYYYYYLCHPWKIENREHPKHSVYMYNVCVYNHLQ